MRPSVNRTCCGRSDWLLTLNYTVTKQSPLPMALPMDRDPLPRFQLPNESSGAARSAAQQEEDALDLVPTEQRRPISAIRARRILRAPAPPDSTQDVAVEDILLEAYAEPPPPPPQTKRTIAPPPRPVEIQVDVDPEVEVDALLRESLAAPRPQPPMYYAPPPFPQMATPITPSLAPVALSSLVPPPLEAAKKRSSGALFLVACLVLVVLGAATGGAVVFAMPDGSLAKLRQTAIGTETSERAPAVQVDRAPAPAPALVPQGPVAVPVSSLPQPSSEPGQTRVLFKSRARGHRVYVDGVVLKGAHGAPAATTLACGKHTIKVGSAGKAKVYDLPCGGEITLP